ncbi:insulinase family protein [Alicyclobacillaceae bacterium I2511]|nr:insulinase family protein [Alicyclobacillaceae bacterium I2511]
MQVHEHQQLGIRVVEEQLANGLHVLLLPKPGFRQSFCALATHYGSIDRTFRIAGETKFTAVPDGVAHFLEHKMFDSPRGDVFPEFSRNGASANAFTTFDMTAYLFSATGSIAENVATLLDFVQEPYFTEQTVEKEKGIIGQEIQMYQDNPDTRAFYELLRNLYAEHPVRIDIAGTQESIAKIDKEILYRCYDSFYHPANMVFVAVGGFDEVQMMKTVRENQERKTFSPVPLVERNYPVEPVGVNRTRGEISLAVSQARCLVGWKDSAGQQGQSLLEQELLTGLVLDVLFGHSSEFYHSQIDQGKIDASFGWEYELTAGYGYSLVGGNTSHPENLYQEILNHVRKFQDIGLSEEDFERCRRKAIGRFYSTLDAPGYLGRAMMSYHLKGANVFDTASVLQGMTLGQANQRLKDHFIPDRCALSVVLPRS